MWKLTVTAGAAALIVACSAENAESQAQDTTATPRVSLKPSLKRNTDPSVGRDLFVAKGCVICHAVNGVGGKAATPLDAQIGSGQPDSLEFAARMWRGAPAMIELQKAELGYTIDLSADEIAHLAVFASDREAQRHLTPDSVPEGVAAGFLDQRFWEVESWDGLSQDTMLNEPVPPADSPDDTN
ncbi:hypothetical protein [Hyphococcus sp.]|uniref:hypothetical protein n=1 Tax=Hyphococcus sp. TaxID=2038636 RepID=UPI003CCC2221